MKNKNDKEKTIISFYDTYGTFKENPFIFEVLKQDFKKVVKIIANYKSKDTDYNTFGLMEELEKLNIYYKEIEIESIEF